MKNLKFFSAIAMIAIIGFATSCKKPNPEPEPDAVSPLAATWVSANQNEVDINASGTLGLFVSIPLVKEMLAQQLPLPAKFTFDKNGAGSYENADGTANTLTWADNAAHNQLSITAQGLTIGGYNLSGIPFTFNYTLENSNAVIKFDYDATTAAITAITAVKTLYPNLPDADQLVVAGLSLINPEDVQSAAIKATYNKQ